MSWSDNRSKEEKRPSLAARRESLRQVNLVLEKLSKDEDLQDDFKLPEVKRAIQHWTGQNRLPPEEAVKLTDHRRVVYVLQRIQMLQSVCKEAHIGVPFEQFINGSPRIPDALAKALFGEDILEELSTISPPKQQTSQVAAPKLQEHNTKSEKANFAEPATPAVRPESPQETATMDHAASSSQSSCTWPTIAAAIIAIIIAVVLYRIS